jgi:hypothetical protein
MLNSAHDVRDLRIPPGNRLEALRGTWKGCHSIPINDQSMENISPGCFRKPGKLEILPPNCYISAESCREFALVINEVWEPDMMRESQRPGAIDVH